MSLNEAMNFASVHTAVEMIYTSSAGEVSQHLSLSEVKLVSGTETGIKHTFYNPVDFKEFNFKWKQFCSFLHRVNIEKL